ncbi:MAG: hypothetical protein WC601_04340 [Desulfotomaculaceae bacterium]
MRLNYYLPRYDFVEKHSITIKALPERVFEAIGNLDLNKSKVIRSLLKMRSAYGLFDPGKKSKDKPPMVLSFKDLIEKSDFIPLEKVSKQEIVMGFVGRFWLPTGGFVQSLQTDSFIDFNQTSYCKVAWNFHIEYNPDVTVTLSTETRVLGLGRCAKFLFLIYWAIIKPFSGWIRLEMLKMIKEQAEGYATCSEK